MRISFTLQQVLLGFFLLLLVCVESILLSQLKFNIYTIFFIDLILLGIFYWTLKKWLPSWEKGSIGESDVRRELKRLPPEYLHIADFHKDKKGNVDFVVIGPTGIYTIEVKNTQEGLLTIEHEMLHINGSLFMGNNPLQQAYAEAMSIQDFLIQSSKVFLPVIPILVFSNPKTKMHFGKQKQQKVFIIGIQWLNEVIQEHSIDIRFTPALCNKIKEELNRYGSDIV